MPRLDWQATCDDKLVLVHALLWNMALEDIDGEVLQAFLLDSVPEGRQLDYKQVGKDTARSVAKTACAFANSYGGLVIVGVSDKNHAPIVDDVQDVTPEVLHDIQRQIASRLDPPLDPLFKFVEAFDRQLLLLKIEPSRHRPVLYSGQGIFRHGEQSLVMGRLQLRDAFQAEPAHPAPSWPRVSSLEPVQALRSGITDIVPEGVEVLFRAVGGMPAWPEDQMRAVASADLQTAVIEALPAQLEALLSCYAVQFGADSARAWSAAAPSGAQTASAVAAHYADRKPRVVAHVQVVLGPPQAWPGVTVIADLGLFPREEARDRYSRENGAVVNKQRLSIIKLSFEDIYRTLSDLVTTTESLAKAVAQFLPNGPAGKAVAPAFWVSGDLDSYLRRPNQLRRVGRASGKLYGDLIAIHPDPALSPDVSIRRGLDIFARSRGFLWEGDLVEL